MLDKKCRSFLDEELDFSQNVSHVEMGLILSCAMCADSISYQHLADLGVGELPTRLQAPHQIANLEWDTECRTVDDPNCPSIMVHDDINGDQEDLLRKEKIQQLLLCVGWEVLIDGLGYGRLTQCTSQNSKEIHFLAQIQDGRKYIVPVVIDASPQQTTGMPETKLIQRVISI